ncbi:MAG: hypothetical protein M5U35_08055 [Roseovarius sp.]|nr:hypothetical protein [Roseovarius sp.]
MTEAKKEPGSGKENRQRDGADLVVGGRAQNRQQAPERHHHQRHEEEEAKQPVFHRDGEVHVVQRPRQQRAARQIAIGGIGEKLVVVPRPHPEHGVLPQDVEPGDLICQPSPQRPVGADPLEQRREAFGNSWPARMAA